MLCLFRNRKLILDKHINNSPPPKIPTHLFLDWSKKLSGTGDKWALLGSKLGLLQTDDIQFYKQYPHKGGNGELILRMWKDSDCSYKELVAALRDEEICLDNLALQIESHFATVTTDALREWWVSSATKMKEVYT